MYEEHEIVESLVLPYTAITCKQRYHLQRILTLLLHKKLLYQVHHALQGIITQLKVKCFAGACEHNTHYWNLPKENNFVHLSITCQIKILKVLPGDNLVCTVNKINQQGLEFLSSEGINIFVPIDTEERTIPTQMWRIGAFSMVTVLKMQADVGLIGKVEVSSAQEDEHLTIAPIEMQQEALPFLQQLDEALAEEKNLTKSKKPRVRKKN